MCIITIDREYIIQSILFIFQYFSFEYYEEGGPVFIQIGGEDGAMALYWLSFGAWLEWAKEQKAALFVLEHRYYGKSHPTTTITTKELAWLSSRYITGNYNMDYLLSINIANLKMVMYNIIHRFNFISISGQASTQ